MSRDADILFPVAMPWERQGLQAGFLVNQSAESLVQLRTPVVVPQGEARSDADIVFDLASRLGLNDQFFGGDSEEALRYVLEPTGLTPESLRDSPEGVKLRLDMHYFKYREQGFATPSGRIEFYSESLQHIGQPPLPEFRQPELSAEFPLLITCAKLPDRCHSQHQQAERPGRKPRLPVVYLHPISAGEHGISRRRSSYGAFAARRYAGARQTGCHT